MYVVLRLTSMWRFQVTFLTLEVPANATHRRRDLGLPEQEKFERLTTKWSQFCLKLRMLIPLLSP